MDDYDGGVIADGLFAGCFDPGDDDNVTVHPRAQYNADVLAAKVRDAEIQRIDDLFADLCFRAHSMEPDVVNAALDRLAILEAAARRMTV